MSMLYIDYYRVGGAIRDQLSGRQPKDQDFVGVVSGVENVDKAFQTMKDDLQVCGLRVRTENPEFGTLRATGTLTHAGKIYEGTFDFVLARRDVGGTDGRHPERVEVGTLEDDLCRRDFTINAMAEGTDGKIIDPFGGQEDLRLRILNTVGDPLERFQEDRLRILRALRFGVTLDFVFSRLLYNALMTWSARYREKAFDGVSDQRVREELDKMFRADTSSSIRTLVSFDLLRALPQRLWFKPTLEVR